MVGVPFRTASIQIRSTAAGGASKIEGPLSLGRSFLAAGVPAVIATLWPIEDDASLPLLQELYRRLQAGQDPAAALAGAQAWALAEPGGKSAAPSTWAAFQLSESAGNHNRREVRR